MGFGNSRRNKPKRYKKVIHRANKPKIIKNIDSSSSSVSSSDSEEDGIINVIYFDKTIWESRHAKKYLKDHNLLDVRRGINKDGYIYYYLKDPQDYYIELKDGIYVN